MLVKMNVGLVVLMLLAHSGWAQQPTVPPVGSAPAAPGVGSKAISMVRAGLLEKSFDASSNLANPINAKREMIDSAFNAISVELITEMIGADKFNKNKAQIMRIVGQSSKYIPFSKTSDLVKDGDNFRMSITVNVSLDDLRILLKESGVLRESDLSPVILPLIAYNDSVNGSKYRWWIDGEVTNSGPMMVKLMESSLKRVFRKGDFFILQPGQYQMAQALPPSAKKEDLTNEVAENIASYFQAPLVLLGEIEINKSTKGKGFVLKFQGSVVQAAQQRIIADITRQFETESGEMVRVTEKKMREISDSLALDISNQVTEAWQRGSIGASQIKLVISGRMTIPVIEGFRNTLKAKAREVKTIRERLLSANENVFEVESAIAAKDLGPKLDGAEFANLKLQYESSSDNRIQMKLIKK